MIGTSSHFVKNYFIINNQSAICVVQKKTILFIMKNKLFVLVSLGFWMVFTAATENKSSESKIKVMSFDELQPLLHKSNDTTYVINFWATWCAPCIEELPYFEKLGEKYKDKKLKVLMVSLDFSTQIKSRLIPFIEKNKMKNEVVVLDDPNSNRWIPLVDSEWSGAIPATLIYNKNKRKFYPQEFTLEELEAAVAEFHTK